MQDVALSNKPRIGIDLMGSDTPPEDLVQAVIQLSEENFPAEFFIFAAPDVIVPKNLRHITCPEVIAMEDDPITAVRQKKNSSICIGLQHLQEKKIDAFLSPGNTGALLIAAKTTLKTLPHIDRPALVTLLPTHKKEVAVLDVGANLSLKSHHLLQLAAMGIAYQKSRGIAHPTVGLLNIGAEATKGTQELRDAYTKLEMLNRDRPTFLGNIEGKDVFRGDIDVLVTDGFTGNIFLKTAEGIAAFILQQLEQRALQGSPSLIQEITSLKDRLYVAEHPGAILCGVDGIVVKCHGDITPTHFISSIKGATRFVQHQLLDKIIGNLKELS